LVYPLHLTRNYKDRFSGSSCDKHFTERCVGSPRTSSYYSRIQSHWKIWILWTVQSNLVSPSLHLYPLFSRCHFTIESKDSKHLFYGCFYPTLEKTEDSYSSSRIYLFFILNVISFSSLKKR
jgi:hypothetical protein